MDAFEVALQRAMAAQIRQRLGFLGKSKAWLYKASGVPASNFRRYFGDAALLGTEGRSAPLADAARIAAALGMSHGEMITAAERTAPDFMADTLTQLEGLSKAEREEFQAMVEEMYPEPEPERGRHQTGR